MEDGIPAPKRRTEEGRELTSSTAAPISASPGKAPKGCLRLPPGLSMKGPKQDGTALTRGTRSIGQEPGYSMENGSGTWIVLWNSQRRPSVSLHPWHCG